MRRVLRPLDREVFALAVPALGALAAEPLYVLVDTAIVGHLGTTQLAALAIAATVLSSAFALCIFLTYGTTAQVARLHGAGRDEEAAALGSQALWLGLAIGVVLLVAALAFAPAAVRLMGGENEVADGAVTYLRIAALGAPFFMLATAGQGFLRGIGDLRTPLVILVAAHAVNVVLELLFVYGFGWGLAGSAWGTVIAQAGMGTAFVQVQRRAGFEPPLLARMRPLIRIGAEIAVRTSALLASFLVASAVLARVSSPALAAHQIAFQLFVFLALVLDALAIAAQVMVGRALGAGDAVLARAAATRVILWSAVVGAGFGLVLLGLSDVIPRAFTSDERVVEQAQEIWWLFAALMPLNGAVFALDGILIGAGDTRFLMWGMLGASAVYIPIALLALDQGWGIFGVWCGLAALIVVRLATCGGRFLSERWVLTGALP
jgi:putative MATE family efflux protein